MSLDPSFADRNRAATARIRALVARLTDAEMQTRVGEHWTVAIALAHLAFMDRRALHVLDMSERDGKVFDSDVGISVNDLSLPLWTAIPPREAARLAVESAEMVDRRLEQYPAALLEAVYAARPRWVIRALHRNEHLDDVDASLPK